MNKIITLSSECQSFPQGVDSDLSKLFEKPRHKIDWIPLFSNNLEFWLEEAHSAYESILVYRIKWMFFAVQNRSGPIKLIS